MTTTDREQTLRAMCQAYARAAYELEKIEPTERELIGMDAALTVLEQDTAHVSQLPTTVNELAKGVQRLRGVNSRDFEHAAMALSDVILARTEPSQDRHDA